ncbi:MAG: hypothetical protein HOO00_00135, partial [Rhodospirillaceae bacterium]|nr:hypothetical protein [Rhodospirillaceae bacterium]
MNASCTLSRIEWLIKGLAGCFVLVILSEAAIGGFTIVSMVVALGGLALVFLSIKALGEIRTVLEEATECCLAIDQGDFEAR